MNRKTAPGEMNPRTLLVGASLTAQLAGVWLAGIILSLVHSGWSSFGSILVSALMIIVFGFPIIMLVWLFVTLPLAWICMHIGIHHYTFRTTVIGLIFGVLAVYLIGFNGFEPPSLSLNESIAGAVNGGLVACLFSFFSKSWGRPAEEE